MKRPVSSPAKDKTSSIELGLNAAIVTIDRNEPSVVCVSSSSQGTEGLDSLPFGLFAPRAHRTLEIGLRRWVREQTGLELGYVEQLYTFGDRGRHAQKSDTGPHMVSIGYLALTRQADIGKKGVRLRRWYDFFPWEDWRRGAPSVIAEVIAPALKKWAERPREGSAPKRPLGRRERIRICFGVDGAKWDEEKVLDRYELLYEAGLVEEARRDGRRSARIWDQQIELGRPMRHDHRRIMATAISRMRGKLKYRPLVFELLPEFFTLYELQMVVEAISGVTLHKQNFRRLVVGTGLVEETGDMKRSTGGRPAKLFCFRHEALLERPSPGLRV